MSGGFWKDLGKNIIKTPGAILTTITGAVYRPHRDKVSFVDNFKDYGPEFANPADKSAIVRGGKKALRFAGKVAAPTMTAGVWSLMPKFFANVGRGMNHALVETAEGIRDSKRHWNPKKRNLKPWRYAKTKESFLKAVSWNKKGIPANNKVTTTETKKTTKVMDFQPRKETKEVEMEVHHEKKAA